MVQGNLKGLGLLNPTSVQQAAIPVVLRGENAAIQSYTGSGKVSQRHGTQVPMCTSPYIPTLRNIAGIDVADEVDVLIQNAHITSCL